MSPRHPNIHQESTTRTPKARYDVTKNCESPTQIATRTAKAKVLTENELRAAYLTTERLVALVPAANYYVISCDGSKLLSTHDFYKDATDAIEGTCDVLVFHPAMAALYEPMPVRSCDAAVTWQKDLRNPATVPMGSIHNSRSNTATKEHDAGARV